MKVHAKKVGKPIIRDPAHRVKAAMNYPVVYALRCVTEMSIHTTHHLILVVLATTEHVILVKIQPEPTSRQFVMQVKRFP